MTWKDRGISKLQMAHQTLLPRAFVPLVDGTDGVFSDDSLATAAKNALDLFDIYQVQLVCCPETHHETWADGALTYCTKRGDCIFVGQTPFGDLEQAKVYTAKLRVRRATPHSFSWIMVSDPKGKPIWIPPTGHVLGIYAPHRARAWCLEAPAGNAARVNGALDVYCQITDVEHTDLVKAIWHQRRAVHSWPGYRP
ncbi:MAG: hypothetical protein IPM76_16540 [Chloroflexi bacterium]|nr:hypothetical protein [Chloroflexota bacterium]